MKLFETNFSKEKPELIAAPVLLSTFKFQLLFHLRILSFELPYWRKFKFPSLLLIILPVMCGLLVD